MGCIRGIVKFLLFAFNTIFSGIGITFIALGIIFLSNVDLSLPEAIVIEGEEIKDILKWVAIIITCLGVIIFIVSLSGCVGTLTETKCLLLMFAAFMLILIFTKLYLVIVWNKYTDMLRNFTKNYLDESFTTTGNETFHGIEISFKCCGTTGQDSYDRSLLPPSCCGDESVRLESECLKENAYSSGCLNVIDDIIVKTAKRIKSVLVWIIVVEMLEFFGSVYLIT